MKTILIIVIIISKLTTKFQRIEKMRKNLSNDQSINLKIAETITNEFAILSYIRLTHYHNKTLNPFFKIKNISENQKEILYSKKSSSFLIYYKNPNNIYIGNIPYSKTPLNTFEEQDFIERKKLYTNWYFIFYQNFFL